MTTSTDEDEDEKTGGRRGGKEGGVMSRWSDVIPGIGASAVIAGTGFAMAGQLSEMLLYAQGVSSSSISGGGGSAAVVLFRWPFCWDYGEKRGRMVRGDERVGEMYREG